MSTTPPSPKLPVSDLIDPSEKKELEQLPHDDADAGTNAENNVIVADQESTSSGLPNDQSVEPMPQHSLLQMPGPMNLTDLTLHSPSSQIVGTPFATNSTRFEYPFPVGSTATETHQANSLSSSPSFPSLVTGVTFPGTSSSSSSPQLLATTPPSLSQFSTAFPLELPNYSPTHPKMRTGNPPVPPGLVKKRGRWSFGLLRRRSSNSSNGSQSSFGGSRSPGPPLSPGVPIGIIGDHAVRRDSIPQIGTISSPSSQHEGQTAQQMSTP